MTNIQRFKCMFNCDAARIWNGGRKKFLILGWNRNTRDNPNGQWFKNGEPIHFDYLEEKCVASGSTLRLLLQSAREYKRLLSTSMEDYLRRTAIIEKLKTAPTPSTAPTRTGGSGCERWQN